MRTPGKPSSYFTLEKLRSDMTRHVRPIDSVTSGNGDFRRVLFTGRHMQLVVMSLEPGEDIGKERHRALDQFSRVEQGEDEVVFMESSGTIEIRIHSLAELFNALDPSPLQARALTSSVEGYLISCAGARRANASLQLLVHCPASLRAHGAEISDGIHEHFRRAHALGQRVFKRRLRLGAGHSQAA